MPGPIQLRRAIREDATALCSLNRDVQTLHAERAPELFKAAVDQDAVQRWLSQLVHDPDNHIELAFVDDVAAGYAWSSVERRSETLFRHAVTRVHVRHLAVDPRFRRLGVGARLLASARERARLQGAAGVVLDTWGFNSEAQAFFRAQGFEVARLELFQALPRE